MPEEFRIRLSTYATDITFVALLIPNYQNFILKVDGELILYTNP